MLPVQVVQKNTPKARNCSPTIETLCSFPLSAERGLTSHSCKLSLQKNIFFFVWANIIKRGTGVGWTDWSYSLGNCRVFKEDTVLCSSQKKIGSRAQPRRKLGCQVNTTFPQKLPRKLWFCFKKQSKLKHCGNNCHPHLSEVSWLAQTPFLHFSWLSKIMDFKATNWGSPWDRLGDLSELHLWQTSGNVHSEQKHWTKSRQQQRVFWNQNISSFLYCFWVLEESLYISYFFWTLGFCHTIIFWMVLFVCLGFFSSSTCNEFYGSLYKH